MSVRGRFVVLLVLVALPAAACAGDPGTGTTRPDTPGTEAEPTQPPSDPGAALIRADATRVTETGATDAEVAAIAAADADLGFDLLRIAAAEGGNAMVSPSSIAAALTMLYAGARGETASQMRDVLHLELSDDQVHPARNELALRLAAPVPVVDEDLEPFALEFVNAIWGQRGFPFDDAYLTLLAEHYDAGLRVADFVGNADGERVAINDWIAEQTKDRIEDLLPDGSVNANTRLVLGNAIWFKGNWVTPFDESSTTDGAFTTLDGTTVRVPLMHGSPVTAHATGNGWQAVRLPYAGGASMLVILPDEGRYAEVMASLDAELVQGIVAGLAPARVELTMPRFEFETDLALRDPLIELGMADAFSYPPADFTGITAEEGLFVQAGFHKSFIALDEYGTEAAAATALVVGLTAVPDAVTMTVDRPFLFTITHDATGEVLFAGTVTDPS